MAKKQCSGCVICREEARIERIKKGQEQPRASDCVHYNFGRDKCGLKETLPCGHKEFKRYVCMLEGGNSCPDFRCKEPWT